MNERGKAALRNGKYASNLVYEQGMRSIRPKFGVERKQIIIIIVQWSNTIPIHPKPHTIHCVDERKKHVEIVSQRKNDSLAEIYRQNALPCKV